MRDVAPQIGQPRRHDTMVDHQYCGERTWPRQPSKNSLSIASRGGARRPETFPKTATYCHLLPFWSRKTVTTVSIHFLPFGGVPASLGSRLSTASPHAHERKSKIPSSKSYSIFEARPVNFILVSQIDNSLAKRP
jgi:hypothetical protein